MKFFFFSLGCFEGWEDARIEAASEVKAVEYFESLEVVVVVVVGRGRLKREFMGGRGRWRVGKVGKEGF